MKQSDVVVLGAGPAGVRAALAARSRGLSVSLLDEAPEAGGQIYKPMPASFRVEERGQLKSDFEEGQRLREELAASEVQSYFGRIVWLVRRGFELEALSSAGRECFHAPSLIVATGTYERIIPFPGWTLPGVIGLGAATTLLKGQQILPGRRTVVAGCGPLVTAVAAGVLNNGGELVAAVDLHGAMDFLPLASNLAARPDLLLQGIRYRQQIRSSGAAVLSRHAVIETRGSDRLEEIEVAPVDRTWNPRADGKKRIFHADVLAIGHGLTPGTEVTRLLGADHEFRPQRGGWVARHDAGFRTSIPGLYVAGDGAGVAGALAAALRGELAGATAAFDGGKISKSAYDETVAYVRRKLRRAEAFGSAMARVMEIRPGLIETVTPETIVCRCEDVSRAEIEGAMQRGAGDLNQIKAWTRCGMGPCQGRMCGEMVARLLADRIGGRETVGAWTPRPPIRPILMEDLLGEFEYEEIPFPEPAPA